MFSTCQENCGSHFLEQENSADGAMRPTRDHNAVRSLLQNTKGRCMNNNRGMLTHGVMLLNDYARLHTSARTWELQEHFNWKIFGHPPYSLYLAPSNYHLLTCLKTGCDHSSSTVIRRWWKVSKRGPEKLPVSRELRD
jgi:hypothetical protein